MSEVVTLLGILLDRQNDPQIKTTFEFKAYRDKDGEMTCIPTYSSPESKRRKKRKQLSAKSKGKQPMKGEKANKKGREREESSEDSESDEDDSKSKEADGQDEEDLPMPESSPPWDPLQFSWEDTNDNEKQASQPIKVVKKKNKGHVVDTPPKTDLVAHVVDTPPKAVDTPSQADLVVAPKSVNANPAERIGYLKSLSSELPFTALIDQIAVLKVVREFIDIEIYI